MLLVAGDVVYAGVSEWLSHQLPAMGVQVTRVMTHRRILTDFAHWCARTEAMPTAEMLDVWLNTIAT